MGMDSEDLKARLLAPRADTESGMPEGDVKVPAGTIRVRGLSRSEVLLLQKLKEVGVIKDPVVWEQKLVALGMVDPLMSEDDVKQWQSRSLAGEDLEAVTTKISELSGLADRADKEAYARFRDEPGDRVRVLPGTEAVDDGRGAAGADEQ